MTINGFRMGAPKIAYIGAGVTVRGQFSFPMPLLSTGSSRAT